MKIVIFDYYKVFYNFYITQLSILVLMQQPRENGLSMEGEESIQLLNLQLFQPFCAHVMLEFARNACPSFLLELPRCMVEYALIPFGFILGAAAAPKYHEHTLLGLLYLSLLIDKDSPTRLKKLSPYCTKNFGGTLRSKHPVNTGARHLIVVTIHLAM
ncbi:hypothetical protein BT96DRAFT_942112 [Gymnopus androsaceus JB14]|uniref:Uncharacterized protein n=1 Tax=Gymnopus androsaceus JB14 TaxID=1447944 RepID=A0A6A4HDX8_9AGAR|nr:hypothetical protein BT96DRAFT_942112 [Gymnopus androsaceus JB14]